MHLALARNRLSLSSIGKINHVKKLLEKLSDKRVLVFTGLANVADNLGIPSYHSKSKDDSAYLEFQSGKHNHLALAAMGKVGVTYTDLDSVILLNFTYNAEETSQILNRAIKLDYKNKKADLHVICLNELPELKKVKESLSMLDENKIKYL
jgi:ActR/RegA family two-component response regulator